MNLVPSRRTDSETMVSQISTIPGSTVEGMRTVVASVTVHHAQNSYVEGEYDNI